MTHSPARRGVWILVGALAILALLWCGLWMAYHDRVPRGSTVAGVAIGGLTPTAAEEKLEQEIGPRLTHPVELRAGTRQASVVPAEAGIRPQWAATVESAGVSSANPFSLLGSLVGSTDIPLLSDVDEDAFQAQAARLEGELHADPVDGSVELHGAEIVQHEATPGQDAQPDALRSALRSRWWEPQGLSVDTRSIAPGISTEEVRRIAEGPAARAVSAPIILHGHEGADGILPPERMGEVLSFVPEEGTGRLRPELNREAARGILAEGLAPSEHPHVNAQIDFRGGDRRVTPHQDGTLINWDESLADLEERLVGEGQKERDAVYQDDPAPYTTEMAEHATFDDVLGEFTTGGFSGPSGVNIARVAETVNGAFIAPGEVFSLNGFTGPRGTAQGYVESGVILNGRPDKAVGGGISQFATTLYNAAYFAGMEDVTHTPHSYYISRYPAGREATVYEGAIDLQFRNTSPHGVRIDASVAGNEVTVRLVGVKTVNVESINGGRWAPTEPEEVTVRGGECVAASGAPGFTTSDTRIVRALGGEELSRTTTTTVYDPEPRVRCEP
ncbi:VanW family protein [Corynebacterium uropygiale]|uniref:VanW family protein n=2 Tax=Corynebacterium uropygiale TaxID=1775911 RepID=A0A9X1QQF5_9CORY|nr:VanW family protein [Corynebacterium uropygiale]